MLIQRKVLIFFSMIVWLFLSLKAEKIFLNKIKSNIGSFVS